MRRAFGPPEADESDPFPFTSEQRYRGARVVASAANDVDDCVLLLAILGLDPADGLAADRARPPSRA